MIDASLLPATEILAAYRAKRLSPVEVTKAALERIRKLDPQFNAFCLVDEKSAIAAARESEARWMAGAPRGLLDGIPTSIKDAFLTKGWPTLRGSRSVSPDRAWDEDAPMVARLRDHGAVLLGKTTLPEFSWKLVADSPLTGITRNPWNRDRTPGGSSGGAAVAVATGMSVFAVGTDTGGSTRVPACYTGVFGYKPTYGLAATYPTSNFGSLHHIAPLTRTVADAALLMRVITERDLRDWDVLPARNVDWTENLESGIKGLRVAYSPDLGHRGIVEPEVADAVAKSLRLLEMLGAVVEEVALDLTETMPAFRTIFSCGAASMVGAFSQQTRDLMDPDLVAIAQAGTTIGAAEYIGAMIQTRASVGARMNRFHERYDLLVCPTMPSAAIPAGAQYPDPDHPQDFMTWAPFCYPFNMTRQPAASMPCGFTTAGLPVGLQIVGSAFADMRVLRACHALETAMPIRLPEVN